MSIYLSYLGIFLFSTELVNHVYVYEIFRKILEEYCIINRQFSIISLDLLLKLSLSWPSEFILNSHWFTAIANSLQKAIKVMSIGNDVQHYISWLIVLIFKFSMKMELILMKRLINRDFQPSMARIVEYMLGFMLEFEAWLYLKIDISVRLLTGEISADFTLIYNFITTGL